MNLWPQDRLTRPRTLTDAIYAIVFNREGKKSRRAPSNIGAGTLRYLDQMPGAGSGLYGITVTIISGTSYAILSSDCMIVGTTGSTNDLGVTLPDCTGLPGKLYVITKTDAGTKAIIITTTGAQYIESVTTWSLAYQYDVLSVVSDGTLWHILGSSTHVPPP